MASLPLQKQGEDTRPYAERTGARTDGLRVSSWRAIQDADFRNDWRALAGQASEPNPFAEDWFLSPSLKAYDPRGAVKLLRFYNGGRLCGVMPLKQAQFYYGYPIPHLRGWLHDNAFCGLPLIAAGHELAFWTAALNWADRSTTAPLFLHLSQIPENGPLFSALCRVLSSRVGAAAIVRREERAMLQSSSNPETYFAAAMSGKKRKELRRQHKRLSELGKVVFARTQGTETLAPWIDQFLALEAAGWKGRERSALASTHKTEQLFRTALAGAAQAGKLERLTLALDGRPIAMLANFLTAPGAFSFKTAFDEKYARFSPGVLLQRENLEVLENPNIEWTDSCAAADHPMIERIWREKRTMLHINIGIGGPLRRAAFTRMTQSEDSAEYIGAEYIGGSHG